MRSIIAALLLVLVTGCAQIGTTTTTQSAWSPARNQVLLAGYHDSGAFPGWTDGELIAFSIEFCQAADALGGPALLISIVEAEEISMDEIIQAGVVLRLSGQVAL